MSPTSFTPGRSAVKSRHSRSGTVAGDAATVPDLLCRDFTADRPGVKLVGDITYIPTWQGWIFLATVIDCYTKACIGYAMAEHMRADLVIDALEMASRNYPSPPGRYSTPTGAPNTPRRRSPTRPRNSGSAALSGAPGYASTTRRPNHLMPP